MEKVAEAKRAIQLYAESLGTNRQLIEQLTAKDVTGEDVKRFFMECYARDFHAIPLNPKNEEESRKRDAAVEAMCGILKRFEREESNFGASAWVAFNAYSGWLQHDRKIRRNGPAAREDLRLHSNLFGTDADRTTAAYLAALTL